MIILELLIYLMLILFFLIPVSLILHAFSLAILFMHYNHFNLLFLLVNYRLHSYLHIFYLVQINDLTFRLLLILLLFHPDLTHFHPMLLYDLIMLQPLTFITKIKNIYERIMLQYHYNISLSNYLFIID